LVECFLPPPVEAPEKRCSRSPPTKPMRLFSSHPSLCLLWSFFFPIPKITPRFSQSFPLWKGSRSPPFRRGHPFFQAGADFSPPPKRARPPFKGLFILWFFFFFFFFFFEHHDGASTFSRHFPFCATNSWRLLGKKQLVVEPPPPFFLSPPGALDPFFFFRGKQASPAPCPRFRKLTRFFRVEGARIDCLFVASFSTRSRAPSPTPFFSHL